MTGATDPAVVAYLAWRTAAQRTSEISASWSRAEQEYITSRCTPKALAAAEREWNRAWLADHSALGQLYRSEIRSVPGAVAVLSAMLEAEDGLIEHEAVGVALRSIKAFLEREMAGNDPAATV